MEITFSNPSETTFGGIENGAVFKTKHERPSYCLKVNAQQAFDLYANIIVDVGHRTKVIPVNATLDIVDKL